MALAMLPRFGGRLGDALVGHRRPAPHRALSRHPRADRRSACSRSSAGRRARWPSRAACVRRRRRSRSASTRSSSSGAASGAATRYAELESLLAPSARRFSSRSHGAARPPGDVPPARARSGRARGHRRQDDAAASSSPSSPTTGEADPEDVLRAVFLGLSCELLRCPEVGPPAELLEEQVTQSFQVLGRSADVTALLRSWPARPCILAPPVVPVTLSVRAKLLLVSLALIAASMAAADAYLVRRRRDPRHRVDAGRPAGPRAARRARRRGPAGSARGRQSVLGRPGRFAAAFGVEPRDLGRAVTASSSATPRSPRPTLAVENAATSPEVRARPRDRRGDGRTREHDAL